jgi:hypothetical protein
MVMAGTKNESVMGSKPKKALRVAWLKRKKELKKNQPVTKRKMDITM